jgi:hypothetical protein
MISYLGQAFAGSAAGFFCWWICYPQDIIKTKLQVSSGQYSNYSWLLRDGGFVNCAQDIYRKQGKWGFWAGFRACGFRGAIVGSVKFVVYEFV